MTLDPLNLPVTDNTEQQVKFPKTKGPVGKMSKPHAGMTLFAIEITTGEISKVKYKASSLPHKEKTKNPLPAIARGYAERTRLVIEQEQMTHLVDAKEGVYYVWAINEKNAMKKFMKETKIV